jgi:hypothetical protein
MTVVMAAVTACGGCTATSLKNYTLNQALSVSDMRYRQVMHDLAVVANNPGVLPAFALTGSGTATVARTASIDTTTIWDQAVRGFSREMLLGSATHNPQLMWTLTPVVAEPQLEALHYACLWAILGPPPEGSRAMELLREWRDDDLYRKPQATDRLLPPYHFGVACQLAALPRGWARIAKARCAPRDASYSATVGDVTVWVDRRDLPALSEFVLVVLDISTTVPQALSRATASVVIDPGGGDPKVTETWIATQEAPGTNDVKPIVLKRPVTYAQAVTPDINLSTEVIAPPAEAYRPGALAPGEPVPAPSPERAPIQPQLLAPQFKVN